MYNPQLEIFIRVADAGSFNKASEERYIPPATVQEYLKAAKQGEGSVRKYPKSAECETSFQGAKLGI